MLKDSNETFLVETGQLWKLWFVTIIGGLEVILLVLMISSIVYPENYILAKYGIGELETRTVFLILSLIFLYGLFFLVKCPQCKRKLLYKIIKESGVNDWMVIAIKFKQCPYCNFPEQNH